MSRTGKTKIYAELVKYKCLHPDCKSGSNIEVHHIIPIKRGGKDEYWNLISLCMKCHRKNKLHSEWESKITELFSYKSYFELEMFGFVLDEYEKDQGISINILHNARAKALEAERLDFPIPTETIVSEVLKKAKNKKSEREIAKEYNRNAKKKKIISSDELTRADINRIKHGVLPKKKSKRAVLGLSQIKSVEMCSKCSRFHEGSCFQRVISKDSRTEDGLQLMINGLLKNNSLQSIKRLYFPFSQLGTLSRIRDGIFPKSQKIREAFGLTITVAVPCCPRCGGVHTRKCPKPKSSRVINITHDFAKMIAYARYLKRRET